MQRTASSEAARPSSTLDIHPLPPFLQPEFHYCVHKTPPLASDLKPNKSNPHPQRNFFQINFNIIHSYVSIFQAIPSGFSYRDVTRASVILESQEL